MNYKFCPHCGHKLASDAVFCTYCGMKLPQRKPRNFYNQQFQYTQPHFQQSQPLNYNHSQEAYYHQARHSNNNIKGTKPFGMIWTNFWHNIWNYNGCTNRSDFNKIAIIIIIIGILSLFISGRVGLSITRIIVYISGAASIRRAHDAGMNTGCAVTLFILFGLYFDIAMMFPGSHNYSNGKFKQRAINKGYPPII